MIWSVSEVVATLSRLFTLEPGDLVFTGTPGGQGSVHRGDVLHGGIDKVGELTIRVV
jgi:fumarylpyruvate hydrolase